MCHRGGRRSELRSHQNGFEDADLIEKVGIAQSKVGIAQSSISTLVLFA